MDTPAIPAPKDARERDILERLVAIRDQLLLLKQDRTKYIRTQDVMVLYDQTIEQVRQLNEARSKEPVGENRLDKVLDSCFQLLSLFFMTIGRTSEAPAAYSLTSTIKRLLDHLTEADLFSAKDLDSMSKTLDRLSVTVKNAGSKHSPHLIELLSDRVDRCKTALSNLRRRLDRLGDTLPSVHEKLISILRSMSLANTRTRFSVSEVQKLQNQLKDIDAQRVDGKFMTADGQVAPGSDEVSELLRRCLLWSDIVLERKGAIPDNWRPIYDILVGIRNDLDKLSITQAWSLRETDLYDFQRQLDKIDESRVDGNWLDDEGKPAELYVQRTFLYLIRRSYGYIYSLMISSEPVSEALLPIYNQLQTLKRCLVEVKNSGGVGSPRELYPYSMKLNSIDNMRVDGKFMVGEDIPEGQGSVTELLEECFELNYELRLAAEAEQGES
ncbi:hypothetical protein UCRPA7_2593 [Phaeoacremonium minimum UCRPA7]|uniref:Uncharacterized protein n=1 Tax=Phaeoacremonium minimum (strain UCR-PA7) TaxID=1286976 RepID=R8BRB2_PHAM7|nr:hypothetical protein UCRPA7_2593 [Phaeoacremonium minimum UCRPA7]EOO01912.1 hypothetical protein UCRPA7_2593 [Phaeoacremonium minimum UCRPA7]